MRGHLEFFPARCRNGHSLPAADGGYGAGDGILPYGRKVCGRHGADHGVHHALFPYKTGQRPGIHAADARHAPGLEEGVQIIIAAEIGGMSAVFPHHVALHGALSLEILLNYAVVSDEWEGLHDYLSGVAGICECLYVPAHAGGEHQLAHALRRRAEGGALKDGAVRQYKISFFIVHITSWRP
jgi:hypothetical protein